MSTASERSRLRADDGFSLIEIVVAMGLMMVVLTASLPALLAMLRSTEVTRLNTQAKNLSQERLEQVRDLRFHVDRQNGPFLDLLDIYYTNATAAMPVTTVTAGGVTLTSSYVRTAAAAGGLPAAPFYKTQTGALPGATKFSQVVAAQFLGPDGTALPASRFEDLYNSQVVGADAPPSLVLGLTVVTSWTQAGVSKTYRTYTQVTDGRPAQPLIQSQARAVALDLTSTGADGATLELQAGVSYLDGAQSDGSSVAGYATGALATRTGQAAITGKLGQFSLPTTSAATSGDGSAQRPPGCSWYAFGNTDVANVTADVAGGLPRAPSNVGTTAPFSNQLTGLISATGSDNVCGALSYDNLVGGGIPVASSTLVGVNMGAAPFVTVPGSSGSGASVLGSGYVTATDPLSGTQQVRSGANTSMVTPAVLFPGHPQSAAGLVSAKLSRASVSCVSGTSLSDGTVQGSYLLELTWWGKAAADSVARVHTATWDYDSTRATPLTSLGPDVWAPTTTLLANGVALSSLVTLAIPNATDGVVATGAATGVRGFPTGIFTMTSASTLTNEFQPGFSGIKVQLGQLTCVADDER